MNLFRKAMLGTINKQVLTSHATSKIQEANFISLAILFRISLGEQTLMRHSIKTVHIFTLNFANGSEAVVDTSNCSNLEAEGRGG